MGPRGGAKGALAALRPTDGAGEAGRRSSRVPGPRRVVVPWDRVAAPVPDDLAPSAARPGRGLSGLAILGLAVGYLIVAASVYRSALDGPPISDDFIDLVNPWITDPTPAKLLALFDPTSQASISLTNYKPVSALVHVAQAWLHPENSIAYHAENVLLHALASAMLAAFFVTLGIPAGAAALCGLFFLAHPANVEAVAWMRQLWTPLCMIFSLAALLALSRRPGLATVLFVLALGSKASALFVLPVAAVIGWCRAPGRGRAGAPAPEEWPWRWLAGWTVLCVLFVVAQARATAGSVPMGDADPWLRLWTSVTLPARYLVMALTSLNVGGVQDPAPVESWLDPWWLGSLVLLPVIAVRTVERLRARDLEAAGWVWAAAGFMPVSQIVPFLYPIADRYLYFILPGLLLAAAQLATRTLGRLPEPRRVRWGRVLAGVTFGACVLFSERSADRAALWTSPTALLVDAARGNPDGIAANMLKAERFASAGDVDGTVGALRAAHGRGWDWYETLLTCPTYEPVRSDPRFQEMVRDFARVAVSRFERLNRGTQQDLIHLAEAYRILGETPKAEALLERALVVGGAADNPARERLERLRGQGAR